MKKRIALEKKVLEVLQNELLESTNQFLSTEQIAKVIYGYGYNRNTASIFNKAIRERMDVVKKLAEQNGMLVIPNREPVQGDPNKKFRILGWKIATEDDEKYIFDELLFRRRKGEEHSDSFQSLKSMARRKGFLSGEKIKELQS